MQHGLLRFHTKATEEEKAADRRRGFDEISERHSALKAKMEEEMERKEINKREAATLRKQKSRATKYEGEKLIGLRSPGGTKLIPVSHMSY